ncbi:DNA-processing protein DprA [Mycoplasmatota bacterium]|nr:DNA-processing protein DprA [Mycoplasmatota bacterium]
MSDVKDILLKLHYLDLEINEIYQILKKMYLSKKIEDSILKKVLQKRYLQYKQLNSECIKNDLFYHNIEYVTILDRSYPKKLENIFMPPLILFYQGDLSLLNTNVLAVIGSRKYSSYGEKVTKTIVPQLVKHQIHIISGLAYGIDSIAHNSCIEANGKTIAILGSGIKQVYPKSHQGLAKEIGKNHLLISEYSPNAIATKTHFPFRNRIVSGLSDGVLVIEAKEKSGTLITCDYALDQGKDIFVIPNHIFDENSVGTNNLIKQGANLVTNIFDILENIK